MLNHIFPCISFSCSISELIPLLKHVFALYLYIKMINYEVVYCFFQLYLRSVIVIIRLMLSVESDLK